MSDHLITTRVAIALCPRCQHMILTGIAEGLHTRADITPLNQAGEVAALLHNRWTYTLTREGLIHRDATRIAGSSLHGPTVTDHHCGRPIPAEHRATTIPAATTSRPTSDQPGF